jgi:hypothetical protein
MLHEPPEPWSTIEKCVLVVLVLVMLAVVGFPFWWT